MGVSSSKHKSRITEPEKVLVRLKNLEQNLKQYKLNTERNMQSDVTLAKRSLRSGNKEEAKVYLTKKLYRERQLRSSNAQLDKIDQLINEFECVLIYDELSDLAKVKPKVKRSKWKILLKKKNRRRLKLHEDTEIPVKQGLDQLKNKERDKILKRIETQEEIGNIISRHLREDGADVEAELEAILDANHQLSNLTKSK